VCLDAISGDFRFVVDHCTQNVITVSDLQLGTTTTIQAPPDVTDFKVMGSSRFSPAGDRVAFALARSDPNNEQGWVAVGPSSGGPAEMVLTAQGGSYYTVQGWLDDQTLLVQSNTLSNPNVGSQLFTVGVDGSNLTKVAEGSLLTIIDNR
jgi:tricorn protease-like protein